MGTSARWFMAVTDKAAFIRHFKRLQLFVAVFAVVVFATASAAPRWMWLAAENFRLNGLRLWNPERRVLY